jgi:hypothetical protein
MVLRIKFICRVQDVMITDLLADPARLRPCWLLIIRYIHLTPNYNCDLDVIHSYFKDHVNYFSTYILILIIMVSVGSS